MNSNFVARIRRTEDATKPLIDSELAANLAEIRNVGYQISECSYFRSRGLTKVRSDAILSARSSFKNGLIVSFARHFSGGEISINYAWSHALDEDSNRGFTANAFSATGFGSTNQSVQTPEDPDNLRLYDYGKADNDVKHYVSMNYVREVPFKKAFGGRGPDALVDGRTIQLKAQVTF
jgi:hypothetical protein